MGRGAPLRGAGLFAPLPVHALAAASASSGKGQRRALKTKWAPTSLPAPTVPWSDTLPVRAGPNSLATGFHPDRNPNFSLEVPAEASQPPSVPVGPDRSKLRSVPRKLTAASRRQSPSGSFIGLAAASGSPAPLPASRPSTSPFGSFSPPCGLDPVPGSGSALRHHPIRFGRLVRALRPRTGYPSAKSWGHCCHPGLSGVRFLTRRLWFR